MRRSVIVLGLLIALPVNSLVAQENKNLRTPARFAFIFNMGYSSERIPAEPEAFEQLIKSIKEAHFNVILCAHDAKREAICKKHDVLLFVDLLAGPHHVYKNVDGCKKLCESLRNNPTIYGYHLWSDNITGNTHEGRSRDAKNVHDWDSTHLAYVGSYKMGKMTSVQHMDMFGYYDFHWTRGGHWSHLTKAFALARDRQIPFLRYDQAKPGIVGKGNPNRVGYTIATSIPFGLKGIMYHYDGGVVDPKTWQLDALGQDLKKTHAKFVSIHPELMKLKQPSAVWSTPITVGPDNKPLPATAVPGGLPALPEKAGFEVRTGEVLIGTTTDGAKREVLILANHNPYKSQEIALQFKVAPKKVEWFDRASSRWQALALTDRQCRLSVEDYAVELVRFERE